MHLRRWREPGLLIAVLLGGVLTGGARAAQPVDVIDAWVRAPVPGQKVAVAYLEVTARAQCALVSVASPVAARGELHRTTMEGGVMKMRPAGRIELAAGERVRLAPGGLHVMLFDLRRPLEPGEKVPLTLTLELADSSRAEVSVRAEVRAATAAIQHQH